MTADPLDAAALPDDAWVDKTTPERDGFASAEAMSVAWLNADGGGRGIPARAVKDRRRLLSAPPETWLHYRRCGSFPPVRAEQDGDDR